MRNVKTAHIELRESLDDATRSWLADRLCEKQGILAVRHDPHDSHRLVVEYDAEVVSVRGLLDFLFLCGVYPEPAIPRPARRGGGFEARVSG